jgi:hypothetical protein
MARIVTTAYRPKRPARKRKAVAIKAAIVTPRMTHRKPAPDAPAPANDDAPSKAVPAAAKPAIITTTSRKRARLQRAVQAAEPDDDPEATARVRAFLDRMIRPR